MDKTQFWQLIERTYADESDDHNDNLQKALIELGVAEIESFNDIYDELFLGTYRWDLWAVAYIIAGGCSDDCFSDFCSMLIRRGQKFYTEMLQEPEATALRTDIREEDFMGMFSSCISFAYEELTGAELPPSKLEWPDNPNGTNWKEEDLSKLYPRLCEKFG